MSASRTALANFRTKNPEQCKYKAYLRVEFESTILYYHFYNKDGFVDMKKPRVLKTDNFVEDAVIYKFVKESVQEDEDFAEKLELRINRLIEYLSKNYGYEFEIIDV